MEANPYDASYRYDGNGNLLHLQRMGADSDVQDEFDYQYYEGTNKLRSLQQGEEITYEYDAIGNLIMDHEEGTQISWTPYGKVRSVYKAADNTTIRYRYDASGNRVEKSVEKEGETTLTRYVRDASGNVMAVYTGEAQAEWHLYGSSRLGMGRGKAQSGQLKLGLRSYELSGEAGAY